MDLFKVLCGEFLLEERPLHELLTISALVDAKVKGVVVEIRMDNSNDLVQISDVIIALISSNQTEELGKRIYSRLNELIVQKNVSLTESLGAKRIYNELQKKEALGFYRIRKTRTGYRFSLHAKSGELLASSETYSSGDTCANAIKSVKSNVKGEIEDQTVENFISQRHPKFELYQDAAAEYRFRLKAKNGEIILVSEGYTNKQTCIRAIERVKQNAASDNIEKA